MHFTTVAATALIAVNTAAPAHGAVPLDEGQRAADSARQTEATAHTAGEVLEREATAEEREPDRLVIPALVEIPTSPETEALDGAAASEQRRRFTGRNYILFGGNARDGSNPEDIKKVKYEVRSHADARLAQWDCCSIYARFATLLRMTDDRSSPIRTPSYMLDVEMEFRKGGWHLVIVPYGHHSNGQDGCSVKQDKW